MTLPTLKQGDSGDDVCFFEELLSSLSIFGQALEKLNYEIDNRQKLANSVKDTRRAVRRP